MGFRHLPASCWFILLLLAGAALPLRAEESAEAIVRQMVKRDHELERHRAQYTYTAGETRQKLDTDGGIVSSEYREERIRGDKSPDYGTRDERSQSLAGDAKQASREEPFSILNIISHYNFKRAGDAVVNGVPCYRISFSPKEDQPFRSREEKVANGLSGFLWIARTDYTLVRNVGKLTKPVSVAWFVATLREMEFSFDAAPLPNGELGPSRIEYRFRVQVPFSQIHERHIRVMKDYTLKHDE